MVVTEPPQDHDHSALLKHRGASPTPPTRGIIVDRALRPAISGQYASSEQQGGTIDDEHSAMTSLYAGRGVGCSGVRRSGPRCTVLANGSATARVASDARAGVKVRAQESLGSPSCRHPRQLSRQRSEGTGRRAGSPDNSVGPLLRVSDEC